MNMIDEFAKAWKESMRNETMEINHNNTSMYHEAYKRLRADYIPLASIDMRLRLIPKKIIHNGPATIVYWEDGEKTVVKLMEGDTYDEYAAFTAALAKKIFGSTGYAKRWMKDVTVEQKEKETENISLNILLKHMDKKDAEHLKNTFDVKLADRILNNK